MDLKHGSEILKHLEEQNEALSEAHAVMFRELEVLQVEEEMLMRKLYEIMSSEGLFSKMSIPKRATAAPFLHARKESYCGGELVERKPRKLACCAYTLQLLSLSELSLIMAQGFSPKVKT